MIPFLIDLHSRGLFPLEEFVTIYDGHEYQSAFQDLMDAKVLKAVIRWR